MPIRIVLIDDHPMVLKGLEQLLQLNADFEVVATCGTAVEGLRTVEALRPDVLLLDLKLSGEDGLSVLRKLDSTKPPAVVVLTASQDEDDLIAAARLGARGIVLKAMAPRVLEDCIRTVHAGSLSLSVDGVDLSDRLAQRQNVETELQNILTPRELEILRLVADGLTDNEIGKQLYISPRTVQNHLTRIRHAPEWHPRGVGGEKLLRLVVPHACERERVDAHPALRPVGREVFRQSDQAVLDDGVGHGFHRLLFIPRDVGLPVEPLIRRDHAEIGCDVEDDATAAPGHRAAKNLRAQHRALQIEIHHFVPAFFGNCRRLLSFDQRAGIVNQNIDGAEFLDRALDHRLNLIGTSHVGANRNRFPAGASDLLAHLRGT